jgi:hypothetical protein
MLSELNLLSEKPQIGSEFVVMNGFLRFLGLAKMALKLPWPSLSV